MNQYNYKYVNIDRRSLPNKIVSPMPQNMYRAVQLDRPHTELAFIPTIDLYPSDEDFVAVCGILKYYHNLSYPMIVTRERVNSHGIGFYATGGMEAVRSLSALKLFEDVGVTIDVTASTAHMRQTIMDPELRY